MVEKGMVDPPEQKIPLSEALEYGERMAEWAKEMATSGWEKKPYNEFLDIISNRIDKNLTVENPYCPYCGSRDVDAKPGTTTLVGSSDPAQDPNHHWDPCSCRSCGKSWTMEYAGHGSKDGKPLYNVWYTDTRDRGKVLAGLPTCCEGYIYQCSKCGGEVYSSHYDKGTRHETQILSSAPDKKGVWRNGYDTVFRCGSCGVEIYSSTGNYSYHTPHTPQRPTLPYLRPGWVIYEEVGSITISDKAWDKLKDIDITTFKIEGKSDELNVGGDTFYNGEKS